MSSGNMKYALAAAINAAAVKAIAAGTIKEGDLPEVLLEVPPQKEFGDFATNFAMQSARGLKCNPRLVAQAVIDNLDCPYIAKNVIAVPGIFKFLSVTILDSRTFGKYRSSRC